MCQGQSSSEKHRKRKKEDFIVGYFDNVHKTENFYIGSRCNIASSGFSNLDKWRTPIYGPAPIGFGTAVNLQLPDTNLSDYNIIKSKTGELVMGYIISIRYKENGKEGYIVASDSRSTKEIRDQRGICVSYKIDDNYKKVCCLGNDFLVAHSGIDNFSIEKEYSFIDMMENMQPVSNMDQLIDELKRICSPVCDALNDSMYFFLYSREGVNFKALEIGPNDKFEIAHLGPITNMGVQREIAEHMEGVVQSSKKDACNLAIYLTQYAILREHGKTENDRMSYIGGDICVFDINEDGIAEYAPIHNVLQQDYFSKVKKK